MRTLSNRKNQRSSVRACWFYVCVCVGVCVCVCVVNVYDKLEPRSTRAESFSIFLPLFWGYLGGSGQRVFHQRAFKQHFPRRVTQIRTLLLLCVCFLFVSEDNHTESKEKHTHRPVLDGRLPRIDGFEIFQASLVFVHCVCNLQHRFCSKGATYESGS